MDFGAFDAAERERSHCSLRAVGQRYLAPYLTYLFGNRRQAEILEMEMAAQAVTHRVSWASCAGLAMTKTAPC